MSLLPCSIQWHVDADGAPFGTIDTTTDGVTWTTRTIGGWLPFEEYIDEIATLLGTAGGGVWTASIASSGDEARLRLYKSSGANVGIRMTASMADLLGFTNTQYVAADEHISETQPGGYIQIEYPEWHDPKPVRDTMLTQYRMGRLVSFPWGRGTVYPVRLYVPRNEYSRLTEGPCSTGKVRISATDNSALSESYPDGYLDGFLEALDPSRINDTDEDWLEVNATVYADGQDTRAERLASPVLGHLRRGLAVMYSAKIEGIPKIIAERDLGLVYADHFVFAGSSTYPDRGLVIDSSGAVGWMADRSSGLVKSDSLTFGILDPQNALGYWRNPTKSFRINEELSADETSITVKEDLSGEPTSGTLFLGKECLDYTNTNTGGAVGTHEFTGLSRGTYGYRYEYPIEAISPYCELTDQPRLTTWVGRYVELWASLVDPFGRAVGTTFTDSASWQMFFGHISGLPRYERGVWQMTAHSAERRLATKIGGASQATLYGAESIAVNSEDYASVFVYVPAAAGFAVRVWTAATGDEGVEYTETFLDDGTVPSLMRLDQVGFRLAKRLQYALDAEGVSSSEANAGYIGVSKSSVGTFDLQFGVTADETVFTSSTFAWTIYPNSTSPPWLGKCDGYTIPGGQLVSTMPIYRRLDWHILVEEPQTLDFGCELLPSSGYLAIGTDDETEIVHYSAKTQINGFGDDFHYLLTLDEVQVGGSKPQDWTARGTICTECVYPEGTIGEALLKVIHSSGTGERSATYDVYSRGWGYGFDESHIDSASFLDATFLTAAQTPIRPIITKPVTLEDVFGGLLAAEHYAIGPVRSSNALKIGLIRTRPLNGVDDVSIDDDSILLKQGAKTNELWSGPSQIRWSLGKSVLSHGEYEIVQRNIASFDAKGGEEIEIALNGLTKSDFYAIAPLLGQAILKDTVSAQQLKLQCGGWDDFLPGMNCELDLTHPDVWDPVTGAPGFAGYGRIYGVSRNLTSGVVTVTVHTGGQTYAPLCPGCEVSAIAGDTLTLGTDEGALFSVSSDVLIYNPGTTDETTATITGISGDDVSFGGGVVPGWATAGWTIVTYPDVGDCSVFQRAHTHVDDGQTWE